MNYCAFKTADGYFGLMNPPIRGLTPIARWDIVPYQRINAGETLNLGVVAFSKNGIDRVTFSISGQGYSGGDKVSVKMSLNPQSGVWEYWVPLSCSEFTSDGQIVVEATVQGKDWGIRDKNTDGGGVGLDSLTLTVNPMGTLPATQAWVDLSGNDATGVINDPTHPFKEVAKAMKAIRDWMDANGYGHITDGGIIRVNAGTHLVTQAGIWADFPTTANEWVTITASAGGTKEDTILNGDYALFETKHLRFKGVTVKGNIQVSGSFGTSFWWSDSCSLIGKGQWIATLPIGGNVTSVFYTDSSINYIMFPTRNGVLCRGLNIQHIGGDGFQNIPMVVDCTVDDINPGVTGEHSDAFQLFGGHADNNVIVYGYRATNLHYQGFYTQGNDGGDPDPPPSTGIAIVNVFFKTADPTGGSSQWHRACSHLLFWHIVCTDDGGTEHQFGFGKDGSLTKWAITNFSMKGCVYEDWQNWPGSSTVDFSYVDQNHYVEASYGGHLGTNYTTGAHGLDSYGYPTAGSVLLDRISPRIVIVDADKTVRTDPADVGAYKHV